MAGITHAKVSAISDGADTTLVRPSDWNTEHVGLKIVRKTADEIVNNSTTLQDDDHLVLAMAANEVWYVEIYLLVDSSTVADIKYGFGYPTGCDIKWTYHYFSSRTDAALLEETNTWNSGTGGTGVVVGLVLCAMVANGATAGNFTLRWAQNTAEASNTKVLTNSFLKAYKLT